MLRILLLLFITVPLLELWVLIEVGNGIGGFSTVALCLLTAALGGLLIRRQGISTLIDAQKRMAHGEVPVDHGFHGLMIAFSGILLFVPGFITDVLGFLLLVPPVRQLLINKFITVPRRRQSTVIDAEIIYHDKHIP